jgi:hypothetical protein
VNIVPVLNRCSRNSGETSYLFRLRIKEGVPEVGGGELARDCRIRHQWSEDTRDENRFRLVRDHLAAFKTVTPDSRYGTRDDH